jgi:hypothetical protein
MAKRKRNLSLTGKTDNGESPISRPKVNPVQCLTETQDAAQAEESAFGVKILISGEAPTIE